MPNYSQTNAVRLEERGQVYLLRFVRLLAWAMRRAGRSEASGLCFDHGLEGIAAQRALLLEIEANLCQLLRRQGFVEDPAPGFLAFGLVAAEALPSRMFAETGSGALAQIGRRFKVRRTGSGSLSGAQRLRVDALAAPRREPTERRRG